MHKIDKDTACAYREAKNQLNTILAEIGDNLTPQQKQQFVVELIRLLQTAMTRRPRKQRSHITATSLATEVCTFLRKLHTPLGSNRKIMTNLSDFFSKPDSMQLSSPKKQSGCRLALCEWYLNLARIPANDGQCPENNILTLQEPNSSDALQDQYFLKFTHSDLQVLPYKELNPVGWAMLESFLKSLNPEKLDLSHFFPVDMSEVTPDHLKQLVQILTEKTDFHKLKCGDLKAWVQNYTTAELETVLKPLFDKTTHMHLHCWNINGYSDEDWNKLPYLLQNLNLKSLTLYELPVIQQREKWNNLINHCFKRSRVETIKTSGLLSELITDPETISGLNRFIRYTGATKLKFSHSEFLSSISSEDLNRLVTLFNNMDELTHLSLVHNHLGKYATDERSQCRDRIWPTLTTALQKHRVQILDLSYNQLELLITHDQSARHDACKAFCDFLTCNKKLETLIIDSKTLSALANAKPTQQSLFQEALNNSKIKTIKICDRGSCLQQQLDAIAELLIPVQGISLEIPKNSTIQHSVSKRRLQLDTTMTHSETPETMGNLKTPRPASQPG